MPDILDQQDHQAVREAQARSELLVRSVNKAARVRTEVKVFRVSSGRLDHRARQDPLDHQELDILEPRVHKDTLDRPGHLEQDPLDQLVHRVELDRLDRRDRLVHKVQQDLPDRKVLRESREQRDRLGQADLRVLPEQRVVTTHTFLQQQSSTTTMAAR